VVAYDIADRRRWRRVFRLLRGFGEWVQLSVFQCRLTKTRRRELEAALAEVIAADEDHVLILDLGAAERAAVGVTALGRPFEPVERGVVIV